jgi:hypothetical protein
VLGLITLLLLLVIILIVILVYFYIHRKLSRFSSTFFGTSDFFEGLAKQKQEFESEPKTPFGMESLLLPELMSDFPFMNVEEIKRLAEENILLYFESISTRSIQNFGNISGKLKEEIMEGIHKAEKNNTSISDIDIHKTVLNSYTKYNGICTIVFQTTLGYQFGFRDSLSHIEDRINTEFIYVYDDTKTSAQDLISLKCPNCGAPIKGLKHKICPYCEAGLIDLAPRTLKFNNLVRK